VVLPSEREGLSRSVMEAMSLEVPVVGSDARGVRDLLEGGHGLVFPVGDTAALARAMAWVLDHPHESEEMARRARRRVEEFSLERVVRAHHELYAEALGMSGDVEAGR
jgi:glycosyltransferase involved in cell wall biosynthesis